MEDLMEEQVHAPEHEQLDGVTQYFEQELRATDYNLNGLFDGQIYSCADSTPRQSLLAAKNSPRRKSAFLILDDSEEEDADGSSSLYSRPSNGLSEVTTRTPLPVRTESLRSFSDLSSCTHGSVPPDSSRKSPQMALTLGSRREVSTWSKTSSAISCSHPHCNLCCECYDPEDLINCQCGGCCCCLCAVVLLLKAALGDVFNPPRFSCCNQQIPLDSFTGCIDDEVKIMLQTKYHENAHTSTQEDMPKGSTWKSKQRQTFHRLTNYISGRVRTTHLYDAKLEAQEHKKSNVRHYFGYFRKHTTDSQANNSKCSHTSGWYTLYNGDPCDISTRPSATYLCKCQQCGILLCPGCQKRETEISKRSIMPNIPRRRFSIIFDRYYKP